MYEEALQMPCLISYPNGMKKGMCLKDLTLNVDIAPTLLDFAGVQIPEDMQGRSMKGLLQDDEETKKNWRRSAYYQYLSIPNGTMYNRTTVCVPIVISLFTSIII